MLEIEAEAEGEDKVGRDIMGGLNFEVELKSLQYTRAVGNYTQTPSALKAWHRSTLEQAVPFWMTVSVLQDAVGSLNFPLLQEVATTPLFRENSINYIKCALVEAGLMDVKLDGIQKYVILQPGQNDWRWMEYKVAKLCETEDLFTDPPSGMFPRAKASILFPKQLQFMTCVVNYFCLK